MISKLPLFVQIMIFIVILVGFALIVVTVIDEIVDKEKMSEKAKDKLVAIQAMSFFALFLSGLLALVGAAVFDSHIPLSELSDKIHVEGEKVVFEPIANKFTLGSDYDDSNINNESRPNAKTRTVFISEYDENFDSITLTAQNGYKYKLNYADTKFLLEKGARK